MYLFVVALVALLASIKTANAGIAGTGSVDLTQNGMNDAGLGFSFSDGSSKQKGQELVSTKLHSCKQGALDALYFYVYDCEVPSDFIKDLSENVDGFLFTSDKSLTMKSNITGCSELCDTEVAGRHNGSLVSDYRANIWRRPTVFNP